ncbi:MAG: helix-turn-helix transcriptional regulator [Clostridia bacterium]|nr:helix-turn-helix transcriptional regulator [Clostridia bacterium]
MSTFGQRFKELRKNKGLTQETLAKNFYLNKSSISRYEQNKQLPEMDLLKKFADFFDVSIDYLLGRTDEMKVSNSTYTTEELLQYLDDEQRKEFLELGIKGITIKKDIKDTEKIKNMLLKAIRIVKLANEE